MSGSRVFVTNQLFKEKIVELGAPADSRFQICQKRKKKRPRVSD